MKPKKCKLIFIMFKMVLENSEVGQKLTPKLL